MIWVLWKKAVVKTDCADDSIELKRKAAGLNIEPIIITDSGHTEISYGAKTVLGVGPEPHNLVDQVTGNLSLL